LLTDAHGRLIQCNEAADALFEGRLSSCLGKPCWETTGFRTRHGARFCGVSCPVQRAARAGKVLGRQRVTLPRADKDPLDVELLSFLMPSGGRARRAVLHLVLTDKARTARAPGPFDPDAWNAPRFSRLTPREREILSLLSRGVETRVIAAKLCISPTTVRNHVQHILSKLEVHGRLEAILALQRQPDG
jgi:DNA-binding CsgD family transcriptional regulator